MKTDKADGGVVRGGKKPATGRRLEHQEGEDDLQGRRPADRAPIDRLSILAENPCDTDHRDDAERADDLGRVHCGLILPLSGREVKRRRGGRPKDRLPMSHSAQAEAGPTRSRQPTRS